MTRRIPLASLALYILVSTVIAQKGDLITTYLFQIPEFSNFTTAVRSHPDLVSQLDGLDNVTLLIPNDNAFSKANQSGDQSIELIASAHGAHDLSLFLKYHTLEGYIGADGFDPVAAFASSPSIYQTALTTEIGVTDLQEGAVVTVNRTRNFEHGTEVSAGSVVTFTTGNGTTVTTANDNGVTHSFCTIYGIDGFLTMPQYLSQTTGALGITALPLAFYDSKSENDSRNFTAFIPSNQAWLGAKSQIGSYSATKVSRLGSMHFLFDEVVYTANIKGGMKSLVTDSGYKLSFSYENAITSNVSINQNIKIIKPDIPLVNGVLHIIDGVFNVTDTSHTSQSPPTSSGAGHNHPQSASSSLSTGAEAGIGVGAGVAFIVLALLLFCVLRRRRRSFLPRPKADDEGAQTFGKPELHGGPYDSRIAGPVRDKSELETSIDTRGVHVSQPTIPELPAKAAAYDSATSELPSTNTAARRKPVPLPTKSPARHPELNHAPVLPTALTKAQHQELMELTEEADTLVSELSVIAKRKKALQNLAAADDVEPEDVEGRKGDEYRDLLSREEKVRERLEEVDIERRKLEGGAEDSNSR